MPRKTTPFIPVLSPFNQRFPGMASIAADKWLIPTTPCPPAVPRTAMDGPMGRGKGFEDWQMCNQRHRKPVGHKIEININLS